MGSWPIGEGEAPRHKQNKGSSCVPLHSKTPSGLPLFQMRVEGKGHQPDSLAIPPREGRLLRRDGVVRQLIGALLSTHTPYLREAVLERNRELFLATQGIVCWEFGLQGIRVEKAWAPLRGRNLGAGGMALWAKCV